MKKTILVFALSCHRHASPDECKATTDRYVDLAVSESPGAATMTAAQKQAVHEVETGLLRAKPAYRKAADRCQEVTRRQASCAMEAQSPKAWEACFGGGTLAAP